jgi:hypothetical protein
MAKKRKPRNQSELVKSRMLPESAQRALTESGTGIQDQPFIGPTYANDRRIANCPQARELYTRLYLENQLRAQSYAQIRNQIEGGRPFDPDELRRNGESWRTNVNFNDARAAFRRVSMPYWKMVHEVPNLISVKLFTNAPEAPRWEKTLAENYDRFRDDWGPDYFLQFSGMADDYVMYGTGHAMFPHEDTARFQWMPSVQILMPKRTKSDVDKWELICFKTELTADELWQHVKDGPHSTAAQTAGWNPEMIKLAIRMAAPAPGNTRYFDPNYWQDMISSNDLVIGGVWPPVSVVHEWAYLPDTGKIMHYIFTEKSDVPDYLFEAEEPVGKFRRLFPTAFYNVGSNGLYHTIKGFGVMNYYYATVINRSKCRLVDSATFAMGMNFVKGDNTPAESPPVENYSMINIFPTGMTQLQYFPALGPASELIGTLAQNQSENNFTYNEPQKDIADTRTAHQAEMLGQIANEMSTAGSSIFLSQMGMNFYGESFTRLLQKSDDPDAKKFKKRCLAAGVPQKVLDALADPEGADGIEYTVKTSASPTTASPVVRQQLVNWLMTQIMPLPDANRREILEFATATNVGADGPARFLLPIGVASDPRARRDAIMENVDLGQGVMLGQPPGFGVDPSDAHVEHCDEHLKPLEAICQAVQQHGQQQAQAMQGGQQPSAAITPDHLTALQMTIPHIGSHLQMLSGNETEKAQYQQLKSRFTTVASIAQGLMARLAKAQAMAAANGQPPAPQQVSAAIGGAQQ